MKHYIRENLEEILHGSCWTRNARRKFGFYTNTAASAYAEWLFINGLKQFWELFTKNKLDVLLIIASDFRGGIFVNTKYTWEGTLKINWLFCKFYLCQKE